MLLRATESSQHLCKTNYQKKLNKTTKLNLFLPNLSTATIFKSHQKTSPLIFQPAKINNHALDQQIQSHHKILHKQVYNLQQSIKICTTSVATIRFAKKYYPHNFPSPSNVYTYNVPKIADTKKSINNQSQITHTISTPFIFVYLP